jgi:hypothetical protein
MGPASENAGYGLLAVGHRESHEASMGPASENAGYVRQDHQRRGGAGRFNGSSVRERRLCRMPRVSVTFGGGSLQWVQRPRTPVMADCRGGKGRDVRRFNGSSVRERRLWLDRESLNSTETYGRCRERLLATKSHNFCRPLVHDRNSFPKVDVTTCETLREPIVVPNLNCQRALR